MNIKTAVVFYNLCDKDDDCERGMDHEDECGLAVRDGARVVRYIESEDER